MAYPTRYLQKTLFPLQFLSRDFEVKADVVNWDRVQTTVSFGMKSSAGHLKL